MIATLAWSSIANAITIEVPKGDTPSKSVCPAKINTIKGDSPDTASNKTLSSAQIKQRIADVSRQYGLDYDQLHSVLQCESNLRTNQYGDSGKAFGLAQFHRPTFFQFCQGDYHNADDQLECMAQMFKDGRAQHWSCFRKLYKEVIYHEDTLNYNQLVLNK